MYLGFPLGNNPRNYDFWQPVIEKVGKKLDGWKQFNLSRGGRMTLCNSAWANLPTYCMSLFHMPSDIIK